MAQDDLPGFEGSEASAERKRERSEFKTVKCASCEFVMDYAYYHERSSIGEQGTFYEDKTVCETCWGEAETLATIRLFDKDNLDDDRGEYGQDQFEISDCRNMTAGDGPQFLGVWSAKWVSSGGYRGYYDVIPPKGWARFHQDCSLAWSADSAELENFDKALRQLLVKEMGINLVRAVARTSNVCSAGVDYFVEKKNLKRADRAAKKLVEVYRDPVRFNLTAITGKDPADADWSDHIVAAVGAMLLGRPA